MYKSYGNINVEYLVKSLCLAINRVSPQADSSLACSLRLYQLTCEEALLEKALTKAAEGEWGPHEERPIDAIEVVSQVDKHCNKDGPQSIFFRDGSSVIVDYSFPGKSPLKFLYKSSKPVSRPSVTLTDVFKTRLSSNEGPNSHFNGTSSIANRQSMYSISSKATLPSALTMKQNPSLNRTSIMPAGGGQKLERSFQMYVDHVG